MSWLKPILALVATLLIGLSTPFSSVAQTKAPAAKPTKTDPLDWTYARGPQFNGTSGETGLIDKWDPRGGPGSNVLWMRKDIGTRSTPIVMNGRLYTIMRSDPETPKEGEKVVCLNAKTGKTIWENRFNVWLSDVPDTRVGWSSVIGDPKTGLVYALGVCGYFQCINGETGKTVWSVPMHERFGLLSTYGGRTNFPIIHEDLVIISAIVIGWGEMAKPAHRFVGFDKMTGEIVWFNGTRPLPYDTNYSPPALAVLNGQKAFVFGSGDGAVWAFQPRTGLSIWKYQFSKRGLNIGPVVSGSTVFTGHSEENIDSTSMGSVVAIDANGIGNVTKSGQKWKVDELMVGKSSPLVIKDRLYCFDDRGKLYVLDIKTGKRIARVRLGTVMRASPLYADGKIYCMTANGRWYILQPNQRGVKRLSRGRMPRGEGCHAAPIVSHGRVYIQTTGKLYCLQDKSKKPGYVAPPALAAETPVAKDQKPAFVQLRPADVLLAPGKTQKFRVRLYNSKGQFLKDSPAKFTLNGKGNIDSQGNFSAGKSASHTATLVSASVGTLQGHARIRIVPQLPWKFTFDGLSSPPVTWVGARYRHIIRPIDGSNAMVKITTIPKGTRSRCWFGHSDLSNYTIQAEVRGSTKRDKMPDIGLIAQGYTLDLQGNSQRLQIRTWVPQERMAKSVKFAWTPDVWYRMKFRAEVVGDTAVLRGKVWPRNKPEPKAWTIEAVDDSPNRRGSPGLFGNAKDAELALDNIEVTKNK